MNPTTSEQPDIIPVMMMTLFVFIPLLILVIFISKRKGKNPIKYALLSFIPFAVFYIILYLISLTDQVVNEKMDKIINLLEKNN